MPVADPRYPPRVGMYEVGRTLGEGRFAKVKLGKHKATGEPVAIKIIDKNLVRKAEKLIRREISTMKLLKHPHVVRLLEVLASKKNVYMILEYVDGGELFDRIVESGKLEECEARQYFQQLIYGLDYCHSRGVYHRDLKPENLLLDSNGDLKISDFGLSALSQQQWEDGLFHTTCGTPNYVAPEVMDGKGYEGAPADLWSCGIILHVLLEGALPFNDSNLGSLYEKIHSSSRIEFRSDFPIGPRGLIQRLLDPNPKTRYTIQDILKHEWFQVDDKLAVMNCDNCNLDFDSDDKLSVNGPRGDWNQGPVLMNAFEIISMFSQGLDLSGLFLEEEDVHRSESKFTSVHPAKDIMVKIEDFASNLGFGVKKRDYKLKLYKTRPGRTGCLSIAAEVLEVAPTLFMVEMHKSSGDTLEYRDFQQQLSIGLKDMIWKSDKELHVQ